MYDIATHTGCTVGNKNILIVHHLLCVIHRPNTSGNILDFLVINSNKYFYSSTLGTWVQSNWMDLEFKW